MDLGLKSITLVNSGDYVFSTFLLDGNVLVNGKNGAGKTTFLRPTLFFYNGDIDKLGIKTNEGKKQFKDFYFRYRERSFILYSYKNEYGLNYVLVSRIGTRFKFKFFSVDEYTKIDLKELFFVNNNTLTYEEVLHNIRKNSLDNDFEISSLPDYLNILYGKFKGKVDNQKNVLRYALFNTKADFSVITKTISNIFLNSKVDADEIKKLLVSNIANTNAISLNQLELHMGEFQNKYDSVKSFQDNVSIANSISSIYDEFYINKSKVEKSILTLKNRMKIVSGEQDILEKDKNDLDKSIQKNKKIKEEKELYFKEENKKINEQLGKLKGKIDKCNEIEENAKQGNIEEKIKEYSNLDTLQDQLVNLENQYRITTFNLEGQIGQFDNQVKENLKKIDDSIIKYDNNKVSCKNKAKTKRFNIIQERVKKSDEIKDIHQPKIKDENSKLESFEFKLKELISKKQSQESKEYYKEEFDLLKQNIKSADNINKQILEQIKLNNKEIEALDKDNIKIEQGFENYKSELNSIYEVRYDELDNKIEQKRKQIDFDKESLMGFVNENKTLDPNMFYSLVKDNILTSTSLSPKLSNEDTKSLLGLDINIENLLTLDDIKVQYKELIEQKANLIEEQKIKEFEYENSMKGKIKANNNQRNKLNRENIEKDKEITKNQETIIRFNLDIKSVEQKANKDKQHDIENINNNIGSTEVLKYKQEKLCISLNEKLNDKIKDTMSFYNFELKKLLINYRKELQDLVQQNKLYINNLNIENKRIEENKNKVLSEKGLNPEEIQKLKNDIDNLKKGITLINSYQRLINIYENDKKEYLDYKDSYLQQIKEEDQNIKDLKEEETKITEEIDKSLEEKEANLTQLKDKLKSNKNDLTRYSNFKEKQSELINTIKDESKIVSFIDKDIDINILIDQIYDDIDKRNGNLNKVSKDIKELHRKIIDLTTLHLDEIYNYSDDNEVLRIAKQIKEFIIDNKVEIYKEQLTTYYKGTLRKITKDIDGLFDERNSIRSNVNGIKRELRNIKNIGVIKSIDIKFDDEDIENVILNKMIKLKGLIEKEDTNFSEGLWGVNNDNKKAKNNTLSNFYDLLISIQSTNIKKITLEDCFELEFKVTENNNEGGWKKSLHGIGSEGTDILIKNLIYVSLLSLSKKESLKNNDIPIHCILDEIGKLHPLYFKELLSFANERNIYFINGMPTVMLVHLYNNFYNIYKNTSNLSYAKKVIRKKRNSDEIE